MLKTAWLLEVSTEPYFIHVVMLVAEEEGLDIKYM